MPSKTLIMSGPLFISISYCVCSDSHT